MPHKTRAEVEAERDDLRLALTDILDRVTDALGVEEDEDEDDYEADGANEEED
jgi:hypothetical protein